MREGPQKVKGRAELWKTIRRNKVAERERERDYNKGLFGILYPFLINFKCHSAYQKLKKKPGPKNQQ